MNCIDPIGWVIAGLAVVGAVGCRTERLPRLVDSPKSAEYSELVGLTDPDAPNEVLFSWIRDDSVADVGSTTIDQATTDLLQSTSVVFDCNPYLIDEKLIRTLTNSPHLAWLQVGPKATSDDLHWIGALCNLRGLSLRKADLRQADLGVLEDLRHLEWLSLKHARLPPADRSRLPELPQLEVLVMDEAGVTDEQLPAPGQFPRLTVLSIRSSSISDGGVSRIVQANPGLRYLHLSRSPAITAQSGGYLVALRQLEYLHIGGTPLETSLTADGYRGLRQMQESLPACYIGFGD